MSVLGHEATVSAPDRWIGGRAIRDLIWDARFFTGFHPAAVRGIDLAFFDPTDLRLDTPR
jgi:hypothetical protein